MSVPKNLRTLKTNFEEADGLGISSNGPDMVVPVWNFQSRDTKLEKQNAKKLNENFDTF